MLGEKQFISLLEKLDEGVIITSSEFDIMYANKIANAYFGKKIVGKPIYSLIRNSEVIDAINESQEINISFPYASSIGKHNLQLHYYQKHENPGIIVINDRTEEEKFQNIRRDLIANVSHELRSPLTSITGFIETLQNEDVSKDQRSHFLTIMQEESNRMNRIISDLLSLSKIEIDMYKELVDEVNIIDQINTAKNALEHRASESGKMIKVTINGDIPRIKGDTDQIVEVFHNLFDNAIKYSNDGSTIVASIDLHSVDTQEYIRATIANDGAGINEEHLPRLTERFYRVDKARSRDIGGTGLGLAIVKHILIRHNANMEITSKINGKTKFIISFPCG